MSKSIYKNLTKKEVVGILEQLRKSLADLDLEVNTINNKIQSAKSTESVSPAWVWSLERKLDDMLIYSLPPKGYLNATD